MDKLQRLIKYSEMLKQRLNASIPDKHKHRPNAFKQMLEIDLKKTESKINKLR